MYSNMIFLHGHCMVIDVFFAESSSGGRTRRVDLPIENPLAFSGFQSKKCQ